MPQTDEGLVREPEELDFPLTPTTLKPAKEVAEVPVATPEAQNLTPRQQAEALIEAYKKRRVEFAQEQIQKGLDKPIAGDSYKQQIEKAEKDAESSLNTLKSLPDTVVSVVIPSETMKHGHENEAERLRNSLENFREGFWGYHEGNKATVISPTANKGVPTDRWDKDGHRVYNYRPEPATADMKAKAVSNGGRYEQYPDGSWMIVVSKESN